MRQLLTLLFYSLLVLSASDVAFGQETQGQIKGTVKDSDGAAVSGAEVSLLLANQAIARTAMTDASGNFTLEKIPAGSYGLHVEHTGFLRHRSAVQITSGETREMNVVLEVKQIMENVTVTAEPGQVTDRRKVDTQVNLIPAQEIFERAPEVVAQVVDEEPGVNLQRTSPSLSAVFVRGLTGRNVAVFVDGVRYTTSAQRGGVGTFFSLIEPSALETVEILRGPNSSQYGSDVHGGVVNFISQAPRYGDLDSEFHGKGNVFYTSPTNGFGGNALFTITPR
jgi:outer membrane receptor for ferric coprogen and ferric-rhodotorulic acid